MVTAMDNLRERSADDSYRCVEKMIYGLCWKFVGNGLTFDEALSSANEAYARAYHHYDPAAGASFPTYIYNEVRYALLNRIRDDSNRCNRVAVDSRPAEAAPARAGYRLERLMVDLSDDARLVMRLVIDSPDELGSVLTARSPSRSRRGLWKYLRGLGWTMGRVSESFEELREALEV